MYFTDEDLKIIEDVATIVFLANICELGEILSSKDNKKKTQYIQ